MNLILLSIVCVETAWLNGIKVVLSSENYFLVKIFVFLGHTNF